MLSQYHSVATKDLDPCPRHNQFIVTTGSIWGHRWWHSISVHIVLIYCLLHYIGEEVKEDYSYLSQTSQNKVG